MDKIDFENNAKLTEEERNSLIESIIDDLLDLTDQETAIRPYDRVSISSTP